MTNPRLDEIRDSRGLLPSYAWPGGYPLYYLTHDGLTVCPDCANRETDPMQAAEAYDVNWEDPRLHCEDCDRRIESAYTED